VLGAETQGMIGYIIEQELENSLGHDRPVAPLLAGAGKRPQTSLWQADEIRRPCVV